MREFSQDFIPNAFQKMPRHKITAEGTWKTKNPLSRELNSFYCMLLGTIARTERFGQFEKKAIRLIASGTALSGIVVAILGLLRFIGKL